MPRARRTATPLLAFVLALVALSAQPRASAAAEWTVEVIPVKHRLAEEVADTVRLALTPSGTLTVNGRGNQLVVRDTPAGIAAAKQLLAQLDVAPASIVLTLTATTEEAIRERAVDVRWGVRGGGVAVGNRLPREDGLRIGVVLHAEDGRSLGEARQSIRVLSGGEGRLFTGSTQPLVLGRSPYGGRDVTVQTAGDDLYVRPTALPDGTVRVVLSASSTEVVDRRGTISGSSADTTVVLADGDSVVVGAAERSGSGSTTRWMNGASSSAADSSTLFLLHVDVLEGTP